MQMDVAYAKTALGRSYLEQPPAPERRARRSLLIMADGQRTLQDLLPVIQTLGLTLQDVQAMVAQGLLAPVPGRPAAAQPAQNRPAAVQPAQSRPAVVQPAQDRPVAVEPVRGQPAPAEPARSKAPSAQRPETKPLPATAAGSRGRPASVPAPAGASLRPARPGLAELQHAAAQLLSHMMGRTASRLHDRLRAANSGTALAEWVAECSMYLAAVSGTEHAAQFRAQMSALLAAVSRGEAAIVTPRSLSAPAPAPAPARGPALAPARSPTRLADLVPGRVEAPRGRNAEPTTGPGALLEEG